MDKKKKVKKIFELCFGGILAVPIEQKEEEFNPVKARNAMIKVLRSNKKVVQDISLFEGAYESDYADTVTLMTLGDESEIASYHWHFPVVLKVKVNKGFNFVDSRERKRKLESSIEALVFYNGSWFMSLFDVQQFSKEDDLFECAPNIREILLYLMKKVRLFTPKINAPCVMPINIYTEISTTYEDGKRKGKGIIAEYIKSYKKQDTSNLILEYEIKKGEINDLTLIVIMSKIYFDICSHLDHFYILSALRHWYLEQKYGVVEMYEETCKELKTYLEIPAWNIIKKSLVASRLSRNVSNIRIQLVENRLWQARIIGQSNDIDSYTDRKGIMEHMRNYLKNCISEPFRESSEEYEGYLSTLDHIEKISSQHNTLLLGIVAIIAGLAGVVIGALIS